MRLISVDIIGFGVLEQFGLVEQVVTIVDNHIEEH